MVAPEPASPAPDIRPTQPSSGRAGPAVGQAFQRDGPAGTPELPSLGVIGTYRLLREIKSGGMGALYEAEHPKLKRRVALKMIRADRSGPDAAARFEQEMEALGRLDHPNLVRAMDAGATDDGRLFLVLELLDGMDMEDVVRTRGPLPIADACAVVYQAALGLHYAHEKGAVHRDVKPSNLFLTRDGVVKVLDLGLAHTRGLEEDGTSGERLTPTGQTMGTPDYIAPEQIDDAKRVDRRADLYSLGCTLYQLLQGSPPFDGPRYGTLSKKLIAHVQESPPSLKDRHPDVPAAIVQLLDQLLAKSPDQRPPTGAAVADVLEPFASGSNLVRLNPPPPRLMPETEDTGTSMKTLTPSARVCPQISFVRRRRVLAGVLFGALLLGFGLWSLIQYVSTGVPLGNHQASLPTSVARQSPRVDVGYLEVIAQYLDRQPTDRAYLRFLTLSHLRSQPDEAERWRQAIAERAAAFQAPTPATADADRLVLFINLRQWKGREADNANWDLTDWAGFVKNYPYGLVPPDSDPDQVALRKKIREATGEKHSYLRGDWFVARALESRMQGARGTFKAGSVTLATRHYERPLDLAVAASELGLTDAQWLASAIRSNPRLCDLGLGPLADGGTIDRKLWERIQDGTSLFQKTASELGLATPYLGF